MKRDVAEQVSLVILRHMAELDALVWLLKNKGECDEAEYDSYRREIGNLMGNGYFNVTNHVYREHPDLRPKGDDGPYEVDKSIYEVAGQIRKLAGVE